MDTLYENAETGCCPRFQPEPWQDTEHNWQDKLFVKDRVTSFFHIPLNVGKVVVRNIEKIKAADALVDVPLMLCDETSLWGCDVYISVRKDVPNAQMTTISGNFLTRVFQGHYKNAPKWAKEMTDFVKQKGKQLKKMYFCYTTCPNCAKYYGKNYVVLFAQT